MIPKRDGNRLYYTANADHPLFKEICALVEKTSGITEKLKEVLNTLKGIQCAFIFGSFARGKEKSHSDVDIIIIGEVGLRTLSSKIKELTEQIEREINPHVYSVKSWKEKLKKKDHFIKNLAHYRTLQSLPLILGDKHKSDADYLDTCRKKRNETEYDFAGNVSEDEVAELMAFCVELKAEVLEWLKKNHKSLVK